MKKEKSCGAVIINSLGEYLLLRHLGGHWDFPKGHVEKGETEKETAIREVFEETGLTVTLIDGFRESINYTIRGKWDKEVVFFIGTVTSIDVAIQKSEIMEYKFLSFKEAKELITFDTNRKVLIKANDFLKSEIQNER